jgi:hypothetical protein
MLDANDYVPGKWPTMTDYRKLDATHRLSSYRIRLPVWTGDHSVRTPFEGWTSPRGLLPWYTAHHGGKHNRHEESPGASLNNVVDAVAAVVALLASQFYLEDFGTTTVLAVNRASEYEAAIGDYFEVRFPKDFPPEERYEFVWPLLQQEPEPFQKLHIR